uniref:Cysteine-rich transmembrane CYSTM domain-containing protein n=1 Tax=Fagus sylvatica TaxID=28930 RepID=A0A2N9H1G7_FAGSY
MSSSEPAVAYPPPSTAPTYYVAPPPAGYPTKDGSGYSQNPPPVETKSRGDGFWKGW